MVVIDTTTLSNEVEEIPAASSLPSVKTASKSKTKMDDQKKFEKKTEARKKRKDEQGTADDPEQGAGDGRHDSNNGGNDGGDDDDQGGDDKQNGEKEENEENEGEKNEGVENEEEEEEEDLPPPPHANINGVVWVTRTKNKKKSKQSKRVNVQFVELANSHQSAAEILPKRRRTATAGVAVFQPGRGKCFVKQRFHKSEPVDSSRLKKVPVERSERMIQISNERERAREEEANVASNFQMNPPAPRRTKNNARARRR